MSKNHSIKRSAATGKFTTKSLGKAKASKFAAVEGLKLNGKSTKTIAHMESRGLKGDALRSAITGSFRTKSG